jgi:SAM-dependent methyltransferase
MSENLFSADRKALQRLIREYEVALVSKQMPETGKLLEIGAGNGFQAAYLQKKGYEVTAIDVAESIHLEAAEFPVQIYDGESLPFADESFDIIFSSNVLEHVENCEALLLEMRRVLKPNGRMVHIVPSPSWRFWTSLAHYWDKASLVYKFVAGRLIKQKASGAGTVNIGNRQALSPLRVLRLLLFPIRHGIRGNWLSEVYYFSRLRWKRSFAAAQLRIVQALPSKTFYTGYGIPDMRVSLESRAQLAKYLGSATMVYLLEKV